MRYKTLVYYLAIGLCFQQCVQKAVVNESQPIAAGQKIQTTFTCDQLIVTDLDRVSGTTKSGSRQTLIISQDKGKTGFALDLYLIKGILAWSIHSTGAGECINKDDEVSFTFDDETTLELPNNGDFNCSGDFALYFGGLFGNRKESELLATKEIKRMKITTSEGTLEKNLPASQSLQLMRTFECLKEKLIW